MLTEEMQTDEGRIAKFGERSRVSKKATAKGQILHSIVLEASRSKVLSDRGIDGKGPGSKIQKKPADVGGWIWEISR